MPNPTPAQYRAMLDAAQKGEYAYPAINVTSLPTINAAPLAFVTTTQYCNLIDFSDWLPPEDRYILLQPEILIGLGDKDCDFRQHCSALSEANFQLIVNESSIAEFEERCKFKETAKLVREALKKLPVWGIRQICVPSLSGSNSYEGSEKDSYIYYTWLQARTIGAIAVITLNPSLLRSPWAEQGSAVALTPYLGPRMGTPEQIHRIALSRGFWQNAE